MVKIYTNEYEASSKEFENKMKEIETMYTYPLDHFQKYAIDGIYHDKNVLVTAHTGSGKCLGYNTPVLMYDGSIKMVQDIETGEKVMGDDSTERNVLTTTIGKEEMYRIQLENGETFTCNKSHILCLKYIVEPKIYNKNNKFIIEGFCPKEQDIIHCEIGYQNNSYIYCNEKAYKLYAYLKESIYFNISLQDYISLPLTIQNNCVMYKQKIRFEEVYTYIDPYLFGYLLLQESIDNIYIPNNQLLYIMISKLEKYNYHLVKKYNNTYSIQSNSQDDKLKEEVKRVELFERIHNPNSEYVIPKEYKINSQRFLTDLVAGIIDACNQHNNYHYIVSFKNKNIALELNYILNCLGIRNEIKTIMKTYYYKDNKYVRNTKIYSVYIKITRGVYLPTTKRMNNYNILDNLNKHNEDENLEEDLFSSEDLEYSFRIEELGMGNYYGFTLDKNHKFVLGNFIVSHNTMVGEYAISHHCSNKKKVIYTSPIKSLSNQKFHEFTEKFKDTSFGILTGDIKFNPEADCLIMTTEILRNYVLSYHKKQHYELDFNIDIEKDLGCVIFDEVHYINDKDRGKVWEEVMISLPKQVQFVMLSATIDKVEKFGHWLQDIRKREIIITSTSLRVVPLTHYGYYIVPEKTTKELQKLNKHIDYGKTYKEIVKQNFIQIQDNNGIFTSSYPLTLHKIKNMCEYPIFVKPKHVLNEVVLKLKNDSLLPAICFVFSRKNVETYAQYIQHNLLDDTERNLSHQIEKECLFILKNKIPNYKEYTALEEYNTILNLIKNGIAIHHSGILPIFKEMIEMMFMKGYIKLLFATETFAVGINLPTKCVLFTSLHKFNGTKFRYLYSHEYTQMAGRAGRRGIDKQGVVIHLNNMFEVPYTHEYKEIMTNQPQTLISKFKVHSNLLLKYIDNEENIDYERLLENVTSKSLLIQEIKDETREVKNIYNIMNDKVKNYKIIIDKLQTNIEDMELYNCLETKLRTASKKDKKKIQNELNRIRQEYKSFKNDYKEYCTFLTLEKNLREKQKEMEQLYDFMNVELQLQLNFLIHHNYIKETNNCFNITKKGQVCSFIQEVNGLVLSSILYDMQSNTLPFLETAKDWVCYLTCYLPFRIQEDKREISSVLEEHRGSPLYILLLETEKRMLSLYNSHLEITNSEPSNETEFEIHYDLIDIMKDWYDAKDEEECKSILYSKVKEKGIFIGEFMKQITKLSNLSKELEMVSSLMENTKLKHIFSQIEEQMLKHVAQNISLYI